MFESQAATGFVEDISFSQVLNLVFWQKRLVMLHDMHTNYIVQNKAFVKL